MPDNAIHEGFIRQRKGLIIVSLFLLFYEYVGLEIEQINLLGNTTHVEHPERITQVVWLAWLYFFIRYYQYFHDSPDKGLGSAYHAQLHKLAKPVAVRRFAQNYEPDPDSPGSTEDLSLQPRDYRVLRAGPDAWEIEIDLVARYRRGKTFTTQQLSNSKIRLLARDLRSSKVKAVLHVLINTRFVTEYWLPFLIGAIPLLYKLFSLLSQSLL